MLRFRSPKYKEWVFFLYENGLYDTWYAQLASTFGSTRSKTFWAPKSIGIMTDVEANCLGTYSLCQRVSDFFWCFDRKHHVGWDLIYRDTFIEWLKAKAEHELKVKAKRERKANRRKLLFLANLKERKGIRR